MIDSVTCDVCALVALSLVCRMLLEVLGQLAKKAARIFFKKKENSPKVATRFHREIGDVHELDFCPHRYCKRLRVFFENILFLHTVPHVF